MSRRHSSGNDPPLGDDVVVERLRRHLSFLGLTHCLARLDELLAWATRERPGATALLEHVLGGEVASKVDTRVARRVTTSGLREQKMLEAFDWHFQPTLDKAFILEFARLDFVRRRDDLVLTGKSGTGKSHILKALSLRACQQAISMRYTRCVDCSMTCTPGSPTGPMRGGSRAGHAPM